MGRVIKNHTSTRIPKVIIGNNEYSWILIKAFTSACVNGLFITIMRVGGVELFCCCMVTYIHAVLL